MTLSVIQTNFGSGEWAPKLRSRVDQQKYRTGAALMRNFFVDFSGGGASTRPGTRFINQCKSNGQVRLVGFQPSVSISYVLEFGQNYIRFYSNGAPILEAAVAIQSITPGNPSTINSNANGYANGDWVFISGAYYIVINATTNTYQLTDLFGNNITSLTGTQAQRVYTLATPYAASDLFPNQSTGNPGLKWAQDVTSLIITHPSYVPYILTINSAASWTLTPITFGPTLAAPANPILGTNVPGTNWFYSYIVTAVDNNGQESAPSAPAANGGAGVGNIALANPSNLAVTWVAIAGAVSYNIYKASPQFNSVVPPGAQFGFVGNVTGTAWRESYPGVAPDFSQTPPIVASPIVGGTVLMINLISGGNYNGSAVPIVSIAAAPAGGFTATGYASLGVFSAIPNGALTIFNPNTLANPTGVTITYPNGVVLIVQAATNAGPGSWSVTQIGIANAGGITGAGTAVPANPVAPVSMTLANGWLIENIGSKGTAIFGWNVQAVNLTQGGFGYTSAPAVTFVSTLGSPGPASATTTVSPISNTGSGSLGAAPVGNPRCVTFFQQRMMLASPNAGLQSFYFSQPGSFFNFNTTNPSEDDNGIFGSIISEELNDIRWLITVPTGVMAGTGKGAWLINGGGGISTSNPITPSNVTGTPQAFNGANDMRPLKANLDLLFVTNKGNYVRDQTYNIYANIFTGQDITVISNHLFFGHFLVDWAFAEEPFKTAWVIRDDGQMLSLNYIKEQELVGWAHHDTNGSFASVCSVIETVNSNTVDALYIVVQRLIQGQYLNFVERMADRYFPYGYEDSWCVDCALQTTPVVTVTAGNLLSSGSSGSVTLTDATAQPFTVGMVGNIVRAGGGVYTITAFTSSSQVTATVTRAPSYINEYSLIPLPQASYTIWQPVTSVTGLTQLIGQSVVGVADGAVVGPLTVSGTGSVTLPNSASKITLGLAFTPQLQTLPLDLGEPTVQGKRKKIVAVTVRVADTLGLQLGTTFANLVTMKDFQLGAVPSTSSGVVSVSDLVNPSTNVTSPFIDGRTIIDQDWQEAGNYCLQQNLPYPATILGVMPEVVIGDTGK